MRLKLFLLASLVVNLIFLSLIERSSAHTLKWKKSICRQNVFHKKCRELATKRDLQKLEPLLEAPRYSQKNHQDYKRGYRNSHRLWQENLNITEFI